MKIEYSRIRDMSACKCPLRAYHYLVWRQSSPICVQETPPRRFKLQLIYRSRH